MHTQGAEVGVRVHSQVVTEIHEEIACLGIHVCIYLDIVDSIHRDVECIVIPAKNIVIAVVVIAQIDVCLYQFGLGAGPVYGINDNGSGASGFEPCLAAVVGIVQSHIRILLVGTRQ